MRRLLLPLSCILLAGCPANHVDTARLIPTTGRLSAGVRVYNESGDFVGRVRKIDFAHNHPGGESRPVLFDWGDDDRDFEYLPFKAFDKLRVAQ
ncbi:hypothetical protein IAD21_02431 [Abditibacteriota bacterium]|nr:hypothetical protein IAD21_02431 [Abditibacteriota bacterium]